MIVFLEILISLIFLLYFRIISHSCVLNQEGSFNILNFNLILGLSLFVLVVLILFYRFDKLYSKQSKKFLLGVVGLGLINILERIIWGNICDYISYGNIVFGNIVDLFLFLNIAVIIYAEVRNKG